MEESNTGEPVAAATGQTPPAEPSSIGAEAPGDAVMAVPPGQTVAPAVPEPPTPTAPQVTQPSEVADEVLSESPATVPTSEASAAAPSAPLIVIHDPGQQTLELGVVDSPYAPAAAAAAAATAAAAAVAVSGAIPVHTYGEPDLDEMVDKLAATTPEAAAPSPTHAATHDSGVAHDAAVLAVPQPNIFVATPLWPFLVYLAAWLAFAAALALTMRGAAAAGNLYLSPYYPAFVGGGLGLMVLVVPLVFGIWLWARSKHLKGDRGGLFVSAFLKGALALFLGVAMWWVAYYVAVVSS